LSQGRIDCASNKCGTDGVASQAFHPGVVYANLHPVVTIAMLKVKAKGRQLDVVCHHHLQKKKASININFTNPDTGLPVDLTGFAVRVFC